MTFQQVGSTDQSICLSKTNRGLEEKIAQAKVALKLPLGEATPRRVNQGNRHGQQVLAAVLAGRERWIES